MIEQVLMETITNDIPNDLRSMLERQFSQTNGIFRHAGVSGYWSNVDPATQRELLAALETRDFETVVQEKLAGLAHFVCGDKRAAGLDMLDIQTHHIGVDYGCMWGNLLLSAARRCRGMVGVDKTLEHLSFLKHRLRAEGVDNVAVINADLRHDLGFDQLFDFAIVNGVLEWIPLDEDVALNARTARRRPRFVRPAQDPGALQLEFLRRAARSLKPGGKLYLAIENRFDYQHFLWKRDPHAQLWLSAVLPRALANVVANLVHGRPYVNYLYSARELERLLMQAGFSRVSRYVAFPGYRHPELILPLQRSASASFRSTYPARPTASPFKKMFRRARAGLDAVVYRRLGRLDLAPALVYIARR